MLTDTCLFPDSIFWPMWCTHVVQCHWLSGHVTHVHHCSNEPWFIACNVWTRLPHFKVTSGSFLISTFSILSGGGGLGGSLHGCNNQSEFKAQSTEFVSRLKTEISTPICGHTSGCQSNHCLLLRVMAFVQGCRVHGPRPFRHPAIGHPFRNKAGFSAESSLAICGFVEKVSSFLRLHPCTHSHACTFAQTSEPFSGHMGCSACMGGC